MEQVVRAKDHYGSNDLLALKEKKRSRWAGFGPFGRFWDEYGDLVGSYLEQFQNPLILLLIGSAAISLVLGQLDNAISIALVRSGLS